MSRLVVMNFLNEVAERFPAAISFASGRPADDFFEMDQWMGETARFVLHYAARHGLSQVRAKQLISQYGRTAGIICDLICEQIRNDERIHAKPDQVLVTAGCQEAMELMLRGLCTAPDDVVLVRSPCYIGITGAAQLAGIEIVPVFCDDDNLLCTEVGLIMSDLARRGKRVRAFYLVPDFDNPTGKVLASEIRLGLIQLCAEHSVVIMEDNPYGMFRFTGVRVPTMFDLDTRGCVVFLGTYSKTICPALRIGFIVVPRYLQALRLPGQDFLELLSQRKSFGTLNTSQVSQAIVGGILLRENLSLKKMVAPVLQLYRENRDVMLASLSSRLTKFGSNVAWNCPEGGFFLTVTLPFEFLAREVEDCARRFGVLVMPLSFFALGDDQKYTIRLAFSNVQSQLIDEGIFRLSKYLDTRIGSALPMANSVHDEIGASIGV